MEDPDPRRGVEALMDWFAREGRDLPWRRGYGPYEVLLSEILLQQTRMETALPYYRRFLDRFPDLESLAAAGEPEVLALWTGLGYYRRARNLLAAARSLAAAGFREPPPDEEVLRSLPGLGPYTVGAVRSIAYNLPAPAVDGNGVRVLARWFDLPGTFQGTARRELESLALSLIPPGGARAFNQGLMELGALVCLPRSPRCSVCPLEGVCLARTRGTVPLRPGKVRRGRSETVPAAAGLVRAEGRILLRRRPLGGLWAGFWELPWGLLGAGESPEEGLRRELPPLEGLILRPERYEVRHAFLRTRVRLVGIPGALPSILPVPLPWEWKPLEEAAELPLPAGSRKLLGILRAEDVAVSKC